MDNNTKTWNTSNLPIPTNCETTDARPPTMAAYGPGRQFIWPLPQQYQQLQQYPPELPIIRLPLEVTSMAYVVVAIDQLSADGVIFKYKDQEIKLTLEELAVKLGLEW